MISLTDFQDILDMQITEFLQSQGWDDPAKINQGECENFAINVLAALENTGESHAVSMSRLDGYNSMAPAHAVLVGYDLFFDAECVQGVERWQELPIVARLAEKYPDMFGDLASA